MKAVFTSLSILFFSIAYTQTSNKAGTLDSSFGVNGKTLQIPKGDSSYDITYAIMQPDDKIIEVGNFEPHDANFFVLRFMPDGSLDYGFGDSGKAVVQFSLDYATAYSAAVQADGKIVVVGNGYNGIFNTTTFGLIARLNADGSPDRSFGTNGQVRNNYSKDVYFNTVLIQPDGKIVAGGTSGSFTALVSRYLANGTPDISFGVNGNSSLSGDISCSDLQSDGKLVFGGWTTDQLNPHFLLMRFSDNGNLDNSFGSDGKLITSFNQSGEQIFGLAIDQNDNIFAGGLNNDGKQPDYAVIKSLRDGILDEGFGTGGKMSVILKDTGSECFGIAVQQDDKILLAGTIILNNNTEGDFGTIRLKMDGSVDSSFGVNGLTTTNFVQQDFGYSVFVQQSGKIVVAGASQYPGYGASLVRYNNNDDNKKQIIIAKIRHWIQHHNGIIWDNNNNVSNYVVQRSYDGIHFNSIARINAGSQSNLTYEDPAPLSGTNYYRLRTTSINGAVNYSNVIDVSNNDVKISPNPATNRLHIEGLLAGRHGLSSSTKLTVVDFAGNIKLQAVADNTSYNLNIASLTTGNYLLKIEMNDEVVTKKFVKE